MQRYFFRTRLTRFELHQRFPVIQAIAWQGFIPYAKFIGRNSIHHRIPGGALLLHWIVTVLVLVVVPNKIDDYAFCLGTFVYGYQVMMGIVSKIAEVGVS